MSVKKTIAAISGSLKSTSSNTAILHAMAQFTNDQTEFIIFDDLEQIPPFNPEKEAGNETVQKLRGLLKKADGFIISTPEYAFGVSGVLKNALDWLVSSGELNEKPAIAISASPMYLGGDKALASLLLTLGALGTKMDANSSLSIANVQNKLKEGKVNDEKTLNDLKRLYEHLLKSIVSSY